MKTATLALLLAAAMSGCIPLQQHNMSGGKKYDSFGWYPEDGYGLLTIGGSDKVKTIKLNDAKSYAIGPNGKRYGIRSEPHQYDLDRLADDPAERNVPYVRDRIYIVRPGGSRVGHLQNGDWEFDFIFRSKGSEESRRFNGHFWTFFYNPIIHGPPN